MSTTNYAERRSVEDGRAFRAIAKSNGGPGLEAWHAAKDAAAPTGGRTAPTAVPAEQED